MIDKKIKYIFIVTLLASIGVLAINLKSTKIESCEKAEFQFTAIDSVFKFIKYSKNELYNAQNLAVFYKKLDSLRCNQKPKINILHLGDSHIQADMFSGELRRLFQTDSQFCNGGRGLVFPYSVAKTNNATWYKTSSTGIWETCRMTNPRCIKYPGMAGINAQTNDINATFKINIGVFQGHSAVTKSVKIYFPIKDSSMYLPVVLNPDSLINTKFDTLHQYVEFVFANPVKSIQIGFKRNSNQSSRFEIHGIVMEKEENGMIFHMVGLNGATAGTFLRYEKWSSILKPLNADLIILSLGTNDAYFPKFSQLGFSNNFTKLIKSLQETFPHAGIIITTPPNSYRKKKIHNTNYEITSQLLKQVADENSTALWDLHEIMGGKMSINKWYANKLCLNDKLHFTRKGYELQAKLLHTAILKSYKNSEK